MKTLPPTEPQTVEELRLSPVWEAHELPKAAYHMLTCLWKHDYELADDLYRDGSKLEFGPLFIQLYQPISDKRSVFARAPKKNIDVGIKDQWLEWQKFRLFQVDLRYSTSLSDFDLEWWSDMISDMLRKAFNYKEKFQLELNPYDQDRRTNWIEYLAFNGLAEGGATLLQTVRAETSKEDLENSLDESEHVDFEFWRWDQHASKTRDKARKLETIISDWLCDGPELSNGATDLASLFQTVAEMAEEQTRLETTNSTSRRRRDIIAWIYRELKHMDKHPEKYSTVFKDRVWSPIAPKNVTAKALARANIFCQYAAKYRNTTTTKNLQDRSYASKDYNNVGGLRLIKDCFYGAITQTYGYKKDANSSDRELLSQLFRTQSRLFAEQTDEGKLLKKRNERQAAYSQFLQNHTEKVPGKTRAQTKAEKLEKEVRNDNLKFDKFTHIDQYHRRLSAQKEPASGEAAAEMVQSAPEKDVHRPDAEATTQVTPDDKANTGKRKRARFAENLIEDGFPSKYPAREVTKDDSSTSHRRSGRIASQEKSDYLE